MIWFINASSVEKLLIETLDEYNFDNYTTNIRSNGIFKLIKCIEIHTVLKVFDFQKLIMVIGRNYGIRATVSQNRQELNKKGGRTEAKPNPHDLPISTLKQSRYFALLNI